MSNKLDQLAGKPAESKGNNAPDPRRNRSIRKPLDVARRLDFDHLLQDPKFLGKRLALFNNEAGEIERRIRQGWDPVKGDAYQSVWRPDVDKRSQSESIVSVPVGIGREGQPIDAILMMIDEDLYDEIQKYKQARIDDTDRALRKGSTRALGTAEDGLETYAPFTSGNDRGLSIKNE